MYNASNFAPEHSIRVGLVGTGYVAKLRAEALLNDDRATLIAVVGTTPEKTEAFAKDYQAVAVSSWEQIVEREDIDLVAIATINRDHGTITRAALLSGKHVIVEYPLSVDVAEAEELVTLSKAKNKLLHVEHIELLGGVHQALKQYIPQIGHIFYASYNTLNPQYPAPRKWTYNHDLFGFPLIGALSRLHRLIDLFGKVLTVNCHNRFWQMETEYYQSCVCVTQLSFTSGLLAQVVYGKGETLWFAERKFEVHGENGGLVFDGETGFLVRSGEKSPIEVSTRRGLFAKDTSLVLDHLTKNTPLYITSEKSLYSLKVADAARRSAETGQSIMVADYLNIVPSTIG